MAMSIIRLKKYICILLITDLQHKFAVRIVKYTMCLLRSVFPNQYFYMFGSDCQFKIQLIMIVKLQKVRNIVGPVGPV